MEDERPTAMPAPIRRLAERLATAQDMAASGLYPTAFGYLEEAVSIALALYQEWPATPPDAATVGEEREGLVVYDAAGVWRGPDVHRLV